MKFNFVSISANRAPSNCCWHMSGRACDEHVNYNDILQVPVAQFNGTIETMHVTYILSKDLLKPSLVQ